MTENQGAGPIKRFGRSEQGRSGILWSVYEALEDGDFRNGRLVASFVRREDALAFCALVEPPARSRDAEPEPQSIDLACSCRNLGCPECDAASEAAGEALPEPPTGGVQEGDRG